MEDGKERCLREYLILNIWNSSLQRRMYELYESFFAKYHGPFTQHMCSKKHSLIFDRVSLAPQYA